MRFGRNSSSGESSTFDHLDELNGEIAQTLFDALDAGSVEWDDARIMVIYRDGDDFEWGLRHRKDGELAGIRVTPQLEQLTTAYRPIYNELTGLDLRRFRLTLQPTGRYTVDYRYDIDDRFATWNWPDE